MFAEEAEGFNEAGKCKLQAPSFLLLPGSCTILIPTFSTTITNRIPSPYERIKFRFLKHS
jgi:hypothetical protein